MRRGGLIPELGGREKESVSLTCEGSGPRSHQIRKEISGGRGRPCSKRKGKEGLFFLVSRGEGE